ncbi:MAG: NnrU family protein [Gammaproteobacteria bacterium]|nr:NnrU family protein [Gammaproteobacteria bacterium]
MLELTAGLALFFAAHTFSMFRDARASLVARLGALPYRGLYSLVSLAGFALIVHGYAHAPRIDVWLPPVALRHVTMLLMLPVFVLLAAAYVPGHIKARLGNPMLLALKTWALAHLLINGDLASMLLFGAFLGFAVVDLMAVKRSGRSSVVEQPRALFDVLAVAVGLIIYGAFIMGLHRALVGVPVISG